MHSYEIIWEDRSKDAEKWVRDEFEYLWKIGRPLSEAIVEEIGRCAKKVQVTLSDLEEYPVSVGKSTLVESPIYRRGERVNAMAEGICKHILRAQRAIWTSKASSS